MDLAADLRGGLLPGSDGFIDTPNQRLSIQHILPIRTPADLEKVPIEETPAGSKLRLGDVTTVVTDHPALRGDAVVNGASGAGFLLVVEKSPGADTAAVDRGVRAAMAELAPGLSGVTVDTEAFRPASYLDDALTDLGWAALAAVVLLVLWFGVAWRSWRVAVIALFALAVPMVAAAWIQELRGSSFTALSAAGLLAGLAVVVDDAVSALAAVRNRADLPDALLAVRRPLGWALAVVLLAAVPLLLVGGDNGTLTRAAVFSYLLAVVAGSCTALTVTPALCWLLLRGEQPAHQPPPLARVAERAVTAAGGVLVRSTAGVVACCAVLALAALAIVPQFGPGGLLPDTQDRNLVVQWTAAPGTSLTAMRATAERAAAQLRTVPGVHDVNSTIGQALMGDQIVDVNSGQTWITIGSGADYGAARRGITRVLSGFPGLQHQLMTYAQLSLRQKQSDSRAVTVRLYGTDWGQLQAGAQQLRTTMDRVPGVHGASFALPVQAPTITIDTDVTKAAAVGLKPGDVRRTTAVLIAGIPVGSYYQQQQIFDVAVWSVPTARSNLDEIRNLMLDTPSGGHVALKDIATVSVTPAPVEIDHDDVSRYVDVTASVSGTDLDTALDRVRGAVSGVALPLGSHVRVLSGLETEQSDALKLVLASLACLVGIGLLLQAALRRAGRRSWTLAGVLLLSLPLSLSGGAVTALIAGRHLGAGTLIGFLPVFALAVRGGMLVLRTDNGDDAVSAARDAAFPVLATTVGVLLAVLPFAVRGSVAGTELLYPEALVTAGGAVTTAVVTLGLLPALVRRRRAAEPRTEAQEVVR
ncbi:efflux RND transporter permease subunit [Streptacidiphilus monticola]